MKGLEIRKILSYILPQAKQYKLSFFLSFIGYTVGIVLNSIVRPYVFTEIIDLLSSGMAKTVIMEQALILCAITIFIVILYNAGFRLGDYAVSYFQSKVMKRLYDFTFSKLLAHSYHFFSSNFSGSLIAKSKRFVRSFETLADVVSFQLWFTTVSTVGVIIVLLIKAPQFGYILSVWAIIYVLITLLFIRKKIKYDLLEAEADSTVTGRLSDIISNIINVKIFSTTTKETASFQEVTEDEQIKRKNTWYFGNFQFAVQGGMTAILQIIFIFMFIKLWSEGKVTVGTLFLVQSYLVTVSDHLWNLGKSINKGMKALSDMKEVVDIFEITPDINDPQKPEKLSMPFGAIVFKDVSFSYDGGNPVLKNFNLTINPGEKIGLVGHSGAGKSTITKLLLRFTDASQGSITIDGQNIKNVAQNDLRSVISYVPQEPLLFHRSIKENIAYGKDDATMEDIERVAKDSFAHEFISQLPKGYDTLVGERGVKLSGGERQRVAITRAMLKNSPILILDEATSSLDSISEIYIQNAFVELMKGKTALVIAHRLSTIQKMDRIIVLENGSIAEMGTHKELLVLGGIYADLWNHQSGGFIAE